MNGQTTFKPAVTVIASILGLCLPPSASNAAGIDELFEQGNRACAEEDYDEAIQCYGSILDREVVSPGLFANLAAAHREQGNVGLALLNFERALWLAPRNADIRAGLQSLRRDTALFVDSEPGWTRVLQALSMGEWTWTATASFATLAGLVLLRGFGVSRIPFRVTAAVCLLALLASGGGVAYRLQQMDRFVVVHADAPLLVSPYEAAGRIAAMREGRILRAVDSHGEFTKVVSAAGQAGWMSTGDLVRIVPSTDDANPTP